MLLRISRCGRRRSARGGFTLVELLLVLLILAIALAAAMPRMGGLTEAARLNAASRTIVMTGRYARTMAVLHQIDVDLVIRLKDAKLTVDAAPTGNAAPASDEEDEESVESDSAVDDYGAELSSRLMSLSTNSAVQASREAIAEIQAEKELDRVRVTSVVFTGLEDYEVAEGEARIRYRSNGTCEPHEIMIMDALGDEAQNSLFVEIKVDALGTPRVVERER